MINEIFAFNSLLGVAPKPVPQLEHKHAVFCVKAIREEAKELEDEHLTIDAATRVSGGEMVAIHARPLIYSDPQSEEARWQTVKSVDAGIDAAYFAIGLLARAGLTVEQAIESFLAVHEANMTKKQGQAAQRGDMGVVDAVKPAGFIPPDEQIYQILFGEPSLRIRIAKD